MAKSILILLNIISYIDPSFLKSILYHMMSIVSVVKSVWNPSFFCVKKDSSSRGRPGGPCWVAQCQASVDHTGWLGRWKTGEFQPEQRVTSRKGYPVYQHVQNVGKIRWLNFRVGVWSWSICWDSRFQVRRTLSYYSVQLVQFLLRFYNGFWKINIYTSWGLFWSNL